MGRVAGVAVSTRPKTFPVVETFGPTIQGEGWTAGLPTYFVRLGGCDWRCEWCDSPHAVYPEAVREAPRLTEQQIVERLDPQWASWVTLSGGNPALHELGVLVSSLHREGFLVAVETQGSRWRSWLATVDHLTVSPKPPSSGWCTPAQARQVARFMDEAYRVGSASLKIVVFDRVDLAWALECAATYALLPFYISVGTDSLGHEPLAATAARYREICELVAADGTPAARRARVLPQLHVIAWGHARGV